MAPRTATLRREADVLAPTGVVAPAPIHVQTPTFEGSLASLFAGVRDHKVELRTVPLFPICAAYVAYLAESEQLNLDEAAAALTALAYLIERKAWGLLPTAEPEPEESEPLALPEPTVQAFAPAIFALRLGLEERASRYFRVPGSDPDPYELPYSLGDVTTSDLGRALERALRRANPDPVHVMPGPKRSLSEQMRVLLPMLARGWSRLEELLPDDFTRTDAVWAFLALLELIRLAQAAVQIRGEHVVFGAPPRKAAEPAKAGTS